MSKKTRQLLIVLLVVLLLVIGVALLIFLPTGSEGTTSSNTSSATSSAETVYLYQHDAADIKQITLKNEHDTFVLNPEKKDDEIVFAVEGYEGLKTSNSLINGIASIAQQIVVKREIGKVSALGDFGLKNPHATLVTELKNGKKVTLLLGDTLNSNAKQRYAMVKGEDVVVVVEADSALNFKSTSLLSTSLVNVLGKDTEGNDLIPDFSYVRVSGRGHEKPIEIYPVPEDTSKTDPLTLYKYYIKGAKNIPLSSNAEDEFLLDMCTISASSIAVVNPTDAQKAEYGFDDPIYLSFESVQTDSDVKTTHNLLIGNINDDGTAYAMLKDVNVIYVISADVIKTATMSAHDMRDTLLYMVQIVTVDKVTLTVNGEKYEFLRERTERESSSSATSSGSNAVIYDYETYYNGEKMTMFGKYYQQFLAAYKQEEFTADMRKGDLMIELKLEYFDEFDHEPTVYRIYECEGNDRRAVFEVDGEVQSLVKMSWAQKVVDDTARLLNGEEITVIA